MEHLKKRLARGETEAFVEVYDLLGDRLLKYLTARLNPTDAQDVLQEVFTRIVRYHKRFSKSKNLTAYVFLTARNEANRWVEKKKSGVKSKTIAAGESSEFHARSEPTELRVEQLELVDWLTSQLTEEDYEIVQLKIYSELTFAEIAIILRVPAATVATKYRRAIQKMKSWLNEMDHRDTRIQTQEPTK